MYNEIRRMQTVQRVKQSTFYCLIHYKINEMGCFSAEQVSARDADIISDGYKPIERGWEDDGYSNVNSSNG